MFINVFRRKTIRLLFLLILLVYISNTNAFEEEEDDEEIVDIGVRLTGNNRDILLADLIAEEQAVLNAGHIDGIDLYHFHLRRKRSHRSKRAIEETIEDLKRDARVEFVTVGEPLIRQKRRFFNDNQMMNFQEKKRQMKINQEEIKYADNTKFEMTFDDTLYRKQWYLENRGQFNTPPNHDINMAPAWLAGYSGQGVTLCIVDDGLDHTHPDLQDHYQPQFSYDLNDLNDPDHDPMPRTNDSQNNHGTRCGGAAVGKANNEVCGVGVAYNAFISGIRILDGRITTLLEARALTMFAAETYIKSASWGPTDDGTTMEAPGVLVNAAMDYAVTEGRHGKGIIFVWAAGNGGNSGDDCGADGYASHQNVISIGSINHLGKTTFFSEFCPSIMAVVYTGGRHKTSGSEESLSVGIVTADVGGKCTTSFFGTSAAAPLAAGAFALVLEANPQLNYRDVMHIVARTARIPTLQEAEGWTVNGAGYHVNDRFGFGAIDVAQMITVAQNWTNVQQRYECYHEYTGGSLKSPIGRTVEVSITVGQCINITSIEHVVANISYDFHRRGDVKITLKSPSKTQSEMLSYRENDATHKGIKYFPFMSVHHWGEYPIGIWILTIETREPQTSESEKSAKQYEEIGELSYFGLRIYGSHDPTEKQDVEREKRETQQAYVPSKRALQEMYLRETAARISPNIMKKRDHQVLLKEKQIQQEILNKKAEDQSWFSLFRRAFSF